MGDENTILSAAEARHLLRRTCFGARADEVAALTGLSRGAAVDGLLQFAVHPLPFRPSGTYLLDAVNRWIRHLLRSRAPLHSKLVLFWHDHFATGFSKVQSTTLMSGQIRTLHRLCVGSMKDLVKAINVDPAMMEFLDTARNDKDVPNENYARELQELFTLGVADFSGAPNYVQDDIVQIARAFTGWRYNDKPFFEASRHDFEAEFPERGPKVIFTQSGGFGPGGRAFTVNGEGEDEIDTVTDILFAHTDSDGRNTIARRTARRLLEYFAHPDPDDAVADQVVTASGFDATFRIRDLLRAILVHDRFFDSMAVAPFGTATRKSVKWPIDYVIGTLRLLGIRVHGRNLILEGGSYNDLLTHLDNMGQVLLDPPSVFGWNWETAWISSATLLARFGFARDATSARRGGSGAFRSDRIRLPDGRALVDLTAPAEIVDAVTDILGVTDQFTSSQHDVLVDYLTEGGAHPTLDLRDYDTRQSKLHGLFALVLQSPAYQLH